MDFYCADEQLIIELDGDVHKNPLAEEKNEKRTKKLKGWGYCDTV
ncbi:DUF559 domain-containing protein [Salegentibacter mishustinae]|nr:DUF559 domain-containing protein [Salegentibacter mishustinae]